MSKANEIIKKDLDKLYDIMRAEETKAVERLKEQDEAIYKATSGVALLNSNMTTLIDNLGTFIRRFDLHDEKEMKKYDAIERTNMETNNRLKVLESQTEAIETMKKNQDKFFKIIYIGTGIAIGLGSVVSTVMYIANLLSKIPQGAI